MDGRWNGAPLDFADDAAAITFAHRLERFGDAAALVVEDGPGLSYAELARAADVVAGRLGEPRQLVLIATRNTPAVVAAYLGALRGGHPAILASAEDPAAIARLVETYRPAALLQDEGGGEVAIARLDAPTADLHPALGVMLSTSGTTGASKLVRLSRGNVDANARQIAAYLGLGPGERGMASLPIHYSYGLSVVNSHLSAGAAILLTDRSPVDPAFWDFAEAAAATSLAGVPYSYDLFERVGLRDRGLPALRTMTQAGGRLPPDLAERYARWMADRGGRFFVMYGQTEATARMSYVPPAALLSRPGTIGIAIPGGDLSLQDEDGGRVEAGGGEGELVYRGPNVMLGYAESATDLRLGREVEALATGDLAVREADGFFRITGRRSRFCKPFGLRVSLDEVEAILRRDGLVSAAAGTDDMIAVAYVGDRPAADVAALLAERLSLPDTLFEPLAAKELPQLPSGKVDYRAVLAAASAVRAATPAASPADESDGAILSAFAAVFRRRTVTPEDSFVSLGGDSLAYLGLATELEARLGTLPTGWEELSIAELEQLGATRPARGGWLSARPLSIDMLLRAVAILWIVASHASQLDIGGGVDVLLILLGVNLFRFQGNRLLSPGRWRILGEVALRVVAPYYLFLTIFWLRFGGSTPVLPQDWLLLGNFAMRSWALIYYWFIQGYFQTVLLILLLFSLPPVRRTLERQPVRFAFLALLASVLLKIGTVALFGAGVLANLSPDRFLYLIALGCCIHYARSPGLRMAVLACAALLAVASYLPFEPWWTDFKGAARGVTLLATTAALLFVPQVTLPEIVRRPLLAVAAASFVIYLLHAMLLIVFRHTLSVSWWSVTVAVLVCAGVGIVVSRALGWAFARMSTHRGWPSPARLKMLGRE